jgi:hypothetical protein
VRLVLAAVAADVDFVQVDRTDSGTVRLVMRHGMTTRLAFAAARMLLTDEERQLLRDRFGGPRVADADVPPLDHFVPFVSQSWLDPMVTSA